MTKTEYLNYASLQLESVQRENSNMMITHNKEKNENDVFDIASDIQQTENQ